MANLCLAVILLACTLLAECKKNSIEKKYAVTTFVMGEYFLGALALGQSLVDVGSKMTRIAIVTPDMPQKERDALSYFWEVKLFNPSRVHDLTSIFVYE